MTVPQIVLDLAATVNGGTPLAWHEYDDHWTIVMQDGRKMHFARASEPQASIAHPGAERPQDNAPAVQKPQHELTVQDHRAREPQATIAHPRAERLEDKEPAVDEKPARRHPPRSERASSPHRKSLPQEGQGRRDK